jgi:bile acid:Na+ symporter, BASS family
MDVVAILGLGVKISIFITVLSLGMRASVSDIAHLFRRPGQLTRAMLAIFVIMPIFAILAVKVFTLSPVVRVVLVALSVSPIPPMFPKKAFKSGGEAPFTFGLLAAATLFSIVMIPLAFAVLDIIVPRDTQFSQSFLISTLATVALLPIAIGMALRYLAPRFSEGLADVLAKIGGILLIVSILPILIAILPTMWSLTGRGMILAFIVFALVGVFAGHFLGGPDPKERTVLSLATASRHPGIAIAIASENVVDETPKQVIAAAVIAYLLISAIVIAPFIKWLSRDESGTTPSGTRVSTVTH